MYEDTNCDVHKVLFGRDCVIRESYNGKEGTGKQLLVLLHLEHHDYII